MPNICGRLIVVLMAGIAIRADVTVQYSMTMAPGPALPPHAAEQLQKQMKGFDGATRLQIKGNKARSSGMGSTSITDFDQANITLLDEKTKRFATASQKEFLDAMAERVPKPRPTDGNEAASLKMQTTATKTKRTRQIHDINAEETEILLTAQVAGMPFEMRTVLSIWAPAAGESDRNPALRELAAYSQRAWTGANVAGMFDKIMGQLPGGSAGMSKFVESMKDVGLLLEMTATTSMPGMAAALRQMNPNAAAGLPPGGDDVMFTMTQKLEDLSTAELPASMFSTPKEYKAVELMEMVRQLTPASAVR
jgi:hypothetical protein